MDDAIYNLPAGTIPFNFEFDGGVYTGFNVSTNGFITFGATAPAAGLYTPISGTTAYAGAISAFGRDLQGGFVTIGDRTAGSNIVANVSNIGPAEIGDLITGTGIPAGTTIIGITGSSITLSANVTSTGIGGTVAIWGLWSNILYNVEGTAPNRVFVIQYSNFKRFGTTLLNVQNMSLNFQFRLHETSNVIEIVYNNCSPGQTTFTTTNEVGLRGPNNTFATNVNNRLTVKGVNDNWVNSNPGVANNSGLFFNNVAPANVIPNGLTYTWTLLPACAGIPTGGSVSGPVDVCSGANFTMNLSGHTADLGITYQWQSSPDGSSYSDIIGATNASLTTSQTSPTYYQVIVTCSNSGLSTTSTPVQVLMSPYFDCYCTPIYTNGKTDGDLISQVQIVGTTLLNNTGTAPVNPAYTYFPPNPPFNTQTGELTAGTTYNINITYGSFTTQHSAVWIDFNQNGIFETPSERVGFTTSTSTTGFQTVSFPISIPCNPTPGVYRMRVRNVYSTAGNIIDPCATYGYGETEDYDITILPPPPCPSPTALSASGTTANQTTLNWTAGCVENEWIAEYGPVGFAPGSGTTVAGITTNPFDLTGLNSGTAYDVYIYADCDANGISSATGPANFTTLPASCTGTPTAGSASGPVTICAGSPLALSLAGATMDLDITYQWQSSADGIGYTDIFGATASTYNTTQSSETWYQAVITCINSGMSSTSTPIQVMMSPFFDCYCTPTYTDGKTDGDLISQVQIVGTTLDNNTGIAQVNPSYTYFPPNPPTNTTTAELSAGSTYAVNISVGTWGNQHIRVWIDYNQNGIFEASEAVGSTVVALGLGNAGPFPPASFNISLTCNPPVGVYRMRVRNVWSTTPNFHLTMDPCINYGYGETEDYDITILPPPPCPAPTALAAIPSFSSASVSWVAGCTETEWLLEYGPTGFTPGTGTTISGITAIPFVITGLAPVTNYDVYVTADCDANGLSTATGPVSFTTTPENDLCVDATAVTLSCNTTTSISGNTATATNTGNGPACGTTASAAPGLWYSFEGTGGVIEVSLCGSPYDTKLFIYNGSCGALSCVAGNDDFCGSASQVTFSTIASTTYYVLVAGFGTASGAFDLSITPLAFSASAVATDINCFGGTSTVTVSGVGGVGPYTGIGTFTESAGTYDYIVEDAFGCQATASITISEPALLEIDVTNSSILCHSDLTVITVTATGGTVPYIGIGTFNEPAGTYNYTITDNNGCTASDVIVISQPDAIVLTETVVDVTCFGLANGSIDAVISGGVSPYSISWSNGESTESITALVAGDYDFTITDDNGCVTTGTINVDEPNELSVNFNVTNNDCFGSASGAIDLDVIGGTGPFTFDWSNNETTEDIAGLAAGNYEVRVIDANGCVVVDDADVSEGDEIVITPVLILDASSCITNDGEIQINVAGGDGTYTFNWDNGDVSQNIFNLAPGTYTLDVLDGLGCHGSFITMVGQPAAPTVTLISADDPLCFGDANGEITIDITGGTAPYSFDWSNAETTQNISGLIEGAYNVQVIDDLGCDNTLSVSLSQPDALSITGVATDLDCNNSSNGAVDITVSGGTIGSGYNFSWTDGSAFSAISEDISGLESGIYTIVVTDDNGCSNTVDFLVNAPSAISVSEIITDEAFGNDGAIDLTVSGGTMPYTFVWSSGQTTEDIVGVTAGIYTVTITDDNGCSQNFTYTVGSSVDLSNISKLNVHVYPNPSNGQFFVEIGDANISITSLIVRDGLGRTVHQTSPNSNRFNLTLQNIENGTYFMEMISGEQRIIKTIMIQN